jgi:nicotinamide-nucleotide amidase
MGAATTDLKELMLLAPRLTLAAAESLTCGRVQAGIGGIPGASEFFCGGITAYALAQKVRHLGVEPAEAERARGVSALVAIQMAQGVCGMFGSDLGVATTGYAEPSPGEGVENPFAWWAVAHRAGPAGNNPGRNAGWVALRRGRVECPGANRVDAQQFVADALLAELVAYLLEFRAQRG